ncbi:hypothetical protein BKA65DRAFT_544170 [Rhexocercosporidium sp. MPI-PUGE-AT-0058]|nr:hypothetical protein BKA65DRAFT_544170 [Rhexocercosporidium sp. MPI-PUGE-AT-0058]
MTSTTGTRSIDYHSTFSRKESCLTSSTEWTFEPIPLKEGSDESRRHGQEKLIRQRGRPQNGWTSRSLRKLIRLYLLTDLDLDSIRDRLHAKDFQPSKRNVQEKLTLLLQPNPNKIRPKGDTEILRRLLRECRTLQKTRYLAKQKHRSLPEWVFQDPASHSTFDWRESTDINPDLDFNDFGSALPSLGFDSDFGPGSDLPFPEFGFVPSTTGSAVCWSAAGENIQGDNLPESNEPIALSVCHPLVAKKYPKVNPTYVQDNAGTHLWADFDAPNLKEFEVTPPHIDTLYPSSQVACSTFQHSLSNQDCIISTRTNCAAVINGISPKIIAHSAIIAQRTVRKEDLHEMDAFGNSTMHISAAMSAPPKYLISLVKLGANINRLNNAGQTFLHLVKPEVLKYCDDFCYLLELLRVQGFNFSQHDHLGQSPFHLLMRPWIGHDTLRKIITQMDDLPIHRHISASRDCFGYTVVGHLNLQETDFGTNLDRAILSLSCETETSISASTGLRTQAAPSSSDVQTSPDEQASRNYENHPHLETISDLYLYEQHVDYWRTILTAKDSPWFEDSKGRNGLHCLAEAPLVTVWGII